MSPARTIVSPSWPVVLSLAAGLAGAAAAEQARPLAAGETVEREIAAGQAQAYALRLETGQFFHVTLVQKSIDVSLALVGADGKRSREADFSEGPQGREALSLVIESTGDFRLEVRSKPVAIGEGRYALTVDPPRSPGPADRDRVTAEELLSEGARLYKEGRAESYRQAIEAFDKALPLWRSLGEPFFEALCLFRKGATQRQLGEYHQARDLHTEALSRWRALGERLFEARALDALGTTYFFLNENEKALDHYLQALEIRRAVGDREGEAASLLNVSVGYGALGQLRTSVSWQEQALVQLRALGDRRREATLLHNMAVVYYRTGRLQKALDHLEEALAMSGAVGDRAQEAATLGTLAVVYGALGEPQDALQRYRQSLDLWRALGQRSGEATTLTEMGRVHASLGETETALEYYRQALDLRRAMQDRKEAGTLLSMGMAYKDLGDLPKAAGVLAEALRLSQETKDVLTEASLLSGLGQVYAAQGEAPKAMGHLEQALALRQRLNDRAEQAAVLHELARVDLLLGQVPRARERLEAALGLIEAVRDEVASHELRAALVARSGQVHDLYLDVLMREHGQDPSAGFEARAFEASERSRVQSLLELLAESHADLREGADPALLEREASLQEQLRFRLERQMRLLTGPHTEEQVAAADAEVRAIRSDYSRLQGQIRADSPRYAALRQPQVLTLHDIQERVLDPQTLLLEYSLGDERSFLFAVGSGTLRSYTLPGRPEIEAAARRAYSLLSRRRVGGADAELAEALATLSRMLLEPVAGEMGGKRLLVVPEGDLQYVPFGALPVPGRPSVALVAEHEVVAVPSGSLLAALREEAAGRKRPPKTLAVFADPVFNGHDERVRARPDGRMAAKTTRGDGEPPPGDLTRAAAQSGLDVDVLPRLPYTRREAEAILALAPRRQTRAALGFEATLKTALSGELNEYRLVHFATHGFFNNTNPEMSGLVLSLVDAEGKSQEGFLSAGEVFNLRLSADLVVLSGCRTALGKQMKGEGVVGLTRAFMYAGTSRVLASLWSVDDAATATLMTRFYEGILAGGLTPGQALQKAQLAVARQRQWRHPYYWAGFQLQGDWK